MPSLTNQPAAIDIAHVDVRRGDLHILQDISAVVPQGSSTVLVGPNGAGKSLSLIHIFMREGQRFYLGNTLMQKGIQSPVFTAANGFDTGRDLFIIDGIDAVYAEDPQCHQRQKGKPQMRDEQTAEDASVFPVSYTHLDVYKRQGSYSARR